jgi:hypothetical protein
MGTTRGAIVGILLASLAAAAKPARAQQSTSCTTPALEVRIEGVTRAGGTTQPTLHIADPNPPGQASGYNVYRSPSPETPAHLWSLRAFDAQDESALPGVQWTDRSRDVAASGVHFYLVAPYNGPCAEEGPWRTHAAGDTDGDLLADHEDGCPATPEGATLHVDGCSATDLLLRPEVLVDPIDEGITRFLARSADQTPPDPCRESLEAAQAELDRVFGAMWNATPCDAQVSYEAALGHLDAAIVSLEDYIAQLARVSGAAAGAGSPEGVEGPWDWGSPEALYWKGQLHVLRLLAERAAELSRATSGVCTEGRLGTPSEGRVPSIEDDQRLLVLDSSQRVVLARNVTIHGQERLARDAEVSVEGSDYGGILYGTLLAKVASSIDFLPGPFYDFCLAIRLAPVQPLPGNPFHQGFYVRHPFDGYLGATGVLELEAGTRLIAEDYGCPGILHGAGPSGEDMRLDYFYEISLSYQPKQGNWVSGLILANELDGSSFPMSLPEMNPQVNATLVATKLKRACLDSGLTIPILDPISGNIVGSEIWWQCAPEVVVDVTSRTVRVREPQAYCDASYGSTSFGIEDHEVQDWAPTSVASVSVASGLVPQPVAFGAFGDRVLNGTPVHGQAVGLGQSFAVYGPFGHHHVGYGTNRSSFLDWPHVTGTRNNLPFRYSCSVPRLVTDVVWGCLDTPTFYRLPFPNGYLVLVSQGNWGTFSHGGWQWAALDLIGNAGEPVRATRGGTVVKVRKDMSLNCETQECTNTGFPLLDEYGNHVAIQHQDGSVGWYAHMVQNSPAVALGQKVQRGAYLGQVGNTGNSTDPHVHFHVTPEDPSMWGNTTILARYETLSWPLLQHQACMVPQQGLFYVSMNTP